jgi:ribosomal protein RSM22 (predicted rRNA methylase)
MQIPAELREATDRALEGVSRKALNERASRMSDLYRSGGASAVAIRDELDALAYAISRLPATYAAVRNALERLRDRSPEFNPGSVLDLGAGPGTASWAATGAWPSIESITQIDSNSKLLGLGASLSASASSNALRNANRIGADITREFGDDMRVDLAILSYTLAELGPAQIALVLASAWRRCSGAVVIVEPGTPQGYEHILRARDLLRTSGARILAPCPHETKCPLAVPDWCHFVQRVARSRDHMLLKSAELAYEDEKFSYLIAVREPLFQPASQPRILARPEVGMKTINVKLCKLDGSAQLMTVTKRDAHAFKRAKKKIWGDEL